MKIFRVTPEGLNPCCEKDPTAVLVWLKESQPNERITIDVIEMSDEEYEKLPEYMGP